MKTPATHTPMALIFDAISMSNANRIVKAMQHGDLDELFAAADDRIAITNCQRATIGTGLPSSIAKAIKVL
jgi:hypothetical protein